MNASDSNLQRAAAILRAAKHAVAFTGAGISVESGIPPFRGPDGLWSRFDPSVLDIGQFHRDPGAAWTTIKKIFYDFMGDAQPNDAHRAMAELESAGVLHAVITQNIDELHTRAGSRNVLEFHGTTGALVCTGCGERVASAEVSLKSLPPVCATCSAVLKPDFVFFGEPIPADVAEASHAEAEGCDVMLIVGTTGEIVPASHLPWIAKSTRNRALGGATRTQVIEINTAPSAYTEGLTDVYLEGKATEILSALVDAVLRGA